MSEVIKGTNITSPVVPFTTLDNYPTHLAEFGKGGFRSVNNMSELNGIPEERREEGMLVYVLQDPYNINYYQLIKGSWVPAEKLQTLRINNLEEIL